MSDVRSEVESMIESLGELSPVGLVLAATARRLAQNIDCPATNERGEASMVSAPANALRACVADLIAKGRAHADEDGDADGWADIAASAGATPIRDAAEPGAGDARRRGRGGRKAAS